MNILVHGVGSKHKLLNQFCQFKLKEHDVFVINGYHFQENYNNWRKSISSKLIEFLNEKCIKFGLKSKQTETDDEINLDPELVNRKFGKQVGILMLIQNRAVQFLKLFN